MAKFIGVQGFPLAVFAQQVWHVFNFDKQDGGLHQQPVATLIEKGTVADGICGGVGEIFLAKRGHLVFNILFDAHC